LSSIGDDVSGTILTFACLLVSENFPSQQFLLLPTVEAWKRFLDEMTDKLNKTVHSIKELRDQIRCAQEEEERKKRKLEEADVRLSKRLCGTLANEALSRSDPELMDLDEVGQRSGGKFPS
jgi:septation ring formation regulator EzrA